MADLQTTDEFLVNRTDTTYTQEQGTLMANLETTDYLLINREDATYKITGEDLINSVIDSLEVTVVITPNPLLINEDATATPVVTGGKKPDGGYVFTYQWHYADDLLGTNQTDIPGQTSATYAVQESDITKFIGCTCTTTDALGTTASGTGYGGPVSADEIAPVIDEVILTEIPNGNRYTDKEFPYTTVMTLDGAPDPTYALKARLSGTTFNFGVQSDTITKVEGGGTNTYTTDTIASVVDSYAWERNSPWSDMTNSNWYNFSRQFVAGPTSDQTSRSDCRGSGVVTSFSGVGITNIKTLEVLLGRRESGPGATFKIDGRDYQGDVSTSLQSSQGQWRTLPGATTFNSFESTGGNGSDDCYLIWNWRVNGILLTNDALVGPFVGSNLTFQTNNNFDKFEAGDMVQRNVSQSQDWSERLTSPDSTILSSTPVTNAFDGNTDSYCDVNDVGKTIDVVFPLPGLIINDKIEVFVRQKNVNASIDNKPPVQVQGDNTNWAWATVANGPETITSLQIIGTTNYCGLAGVRVDGAILVDKTLVDTGVVPAEGKIITNIDDTATPPTITVDGGEWYGADTTGTVGGDTELTKTVAYSTKLTVASDKDLDAITGDIYMTDGTPKQDGSGELEPASYTPVTNTIANVNTTNYSSLSTNASDVENMFDGSILTEGYSTDGTQQITVGPLNAKDVTKFEIYGNAAEKVYSFNGGTAITTNFGVKGWQEFTLPTTPMDINTITIKQTDDKATGIYAFRINGALLIDDSATLTFESPNPDLQYFREGDVVQSPDVKVISTDTTANTMVVDGGSWGGSDGSGVGEWNQSQVWSSNVNTEWDSTNPPANAFDGSTSTQTYGKGGSSTQGTISFTGVTNVTKLRLYFYTGGLNQATNKWTVTVNTNTTIDITALHPNSGTGTTAQWVDVTSALPANFELNTISCATNNQGGLFAVEVNGRLLVDQGIAGAPDPGDTVVTGPTNTAEGTIESIAGTEVDLSTSSGRWIADNKAGTSFKFVPTNAIINTSNEAYGVLQIIGDKAQVTGIQASDPGFVNVTAKDYSIKFPSTFATGNAPDADLPNGTAISAIVRAENETGASVKESNILLSQLLNSLDSADPITALNANDPAHVAMQEAVAAAFVAFPQNVNARRTSIASSLYRLMAGETLTAEETAALTSTVTTAVNAAEPFAYDGYYPLYYTADAANAASSVGDHHVHDMDGQTFYMPDGGTIYHGTYVTPEETEETEETSGY